MKDNKIIIEQSREKIEAGIYPFERKAWCLNLLLERLEVAGYPMENMAQIANVVANGAEKHIRTEIVNNAPSLELAGGIRLRKDAIFDAVELPDLTEIQSAEKLLKQYHTIPLSALVFQDGKFTVSEEIRQQVIAMHTMYAVNDKHIAMQKAAEKVAKAVNEFHKEYGPKNGLPISHHHLGTPESYLTWNGVKWQWEVNNKRLEWFIKAEAGT